MKYIRIFKTLEEANEFKKAILAEKSMEPRRYMVRTLDGEFMTFMNTEWQVPAKPLAFNYDVESIATKKFMNILFKNKVFGKNRDYNDKNIYVDEIPQITTLGKLFSGGLNKETMNIIKSKNIVNDMSCIEKLEALTDISGISNDGEYQNFFAAVDLKKIKLPKTLKTIGKSAFAFCLNLSDIVIPEGVESIKSRAFFDCLALNEIVLPESLKELESLVFSNSAINKIVFKSKVPPSAMKTTFKGLKGDFAIVVPSESYEEYTSQWSIVGDHIIPDNL
jgi:hypothetical protein